MTNGGLAINNGQMGATIHQNSACGSSLTVDWSTGNSQYVQLTGACTLDPSGIGLSGRKYTSDSPAGFLRFWHHRLLAGLRAFLWCASHLALPQPPARRITSASSTTTSAATTTMSLRPSIINGGHLALTFCSTRPGASLVAPGQSRGGPLLYKLIKFFTSSAVRGWSEWGGFGAGLESESSGQHCVPLRNVVSY